MKQYMEENPCADLSPWQFGFREGKSTHDAINHVKVVAGAAIITQLLTGHGCFGTYLHRIGKVPEPYCEHCNVQNEEDSPEHTLEDCKAWEENRNKLCEKLEVNLNMLTLEKLIQQVLRSKGKWEALAEFANTVMLRKEVAERARQEEEARRVNNTLPDGSGSEDS
ncbi:hypothetical protein ACFW04_011764 [Cataglyphis niger]